MGNSSAGGHEGSGMFFGGGSSPAGGIVGEAPGDRIDGYRLIEVIGEGGFGTVWKAEQLEPVRRLVALKVIKAGMDTRAVIARFEAERQALALMNHPGIAAVYDAGSTPRGRPYFVMELVAGVAITKHCARARLPIRERLELFRLVCDAVHHAHMKGIIHRDISASNVLARESGVGRTEVKIIDFGLAKATAHRLTEKTLYTEQGMIVGNPEYMSPEQAELGAQDIDTRTDIYSLGVLLYEMLTGDLPFGREELRRKAYEEIQRIIREVDPPRPSTRVSGASAQQLGFEPGEVSRELRRELEWIPLRAMRKNRGERYQSAAEFAEDIENYLSGRPLRAGPPSTWYAVKKFIRRHRAGVGVGTALLATVVGALVFSTWSWRRAVRSNRVSDGVVAFVREDVFGAIADDSGTMPLSEEARKEIAGVMEPAVRSLASATARRDPWLLRRQHGLMGAVYNSLWEWPKAQGQFENALALAEGDGWASDEELLEYRLGLGEALFRQDDARAVDLLKSSSDEMRTRHGEDDQRVLRARNLLGGAYKHAAMFGEARAVYADVLARRARVLGADHLDTLVTRVNLGLTDFEEGRAAKKKGDEARGELLLGRSEDSLAASIAEFRKHHPMVANAARAEVERGRALTALGRLSEAEASLRGAAEELRLKLGDGHPLTLVTTANLGRVLVMQKKLPEAEAEYASMRVKYIGKVGAGDEKAQLITLDHAIVLVKLGKQKEAESVLVGVYEELVKKRDTKLSAEFAETASQRLKNEGEMDLAVKWERRAKGE